jgi:hypothetical protein
MDEAEVQKISKIQFFDIILVMQPQSRVILLL